MLNCLGITKEMWLLSSKLKIKILISYWVIERHALIVLHFNLLFSLFAYTSNC